MAEAKREKGTPDILLVSGDDSGDVAGERSSNQHVSMTKLAPATHMESDGNVTRRKNSTEGLMHGDGKKEEKTATKSCGKKSLSGDEESRQSSSQAEDDEPMDEQEGTDVERKKKSTRSGRRKRRDPHLKMSTKRRKAYGLINPKRPKSH